MNELQNGPMIDIIKNYIKNILIKFWSMLIVSYFK